MRRPFFLSFLACACLTWSASTLSAKPVRDTLHLISFNDFHGSFQATGNIPGAGRLVKTLRDMRQAFSDVCIVACGDNYSGGYFSRLTGGHPLDEMFQAVNVEYSAIGNHEFDWGIEAMKERLAWGNTRYLAANIFTDSLRGIRPGWAVPYAIKRQRLKNGTSLRTAFIGLSTQETKTAALPEIVKDLDFANPARMAGLTMEYLKDSADLYILLTHVGTGMENGQPVFTDKDVDGLSEVPGIHGILSGHSHQEVYGLLNGVPVVQARNYGRKIAHLRYEVRQDRKGRVHVRFLDGEIAEPGPETDPEMEKSVERYLNAPEYGFNQILTENLQTLAPQDYEPGGRFSRLGALVTTAYRDCYRLTTDDDTSLVIGVCNEGAIRTLLPQGPVTRLQAGNVIPFGGILRACHMNGAQLRELLQYGIECKAGWLQYHDMEIGLENGKITSMTYVGDGKRVDLDEDTPCIIVTENFVASGGDGYDPDWFKETARNFESVHASERNPTDVFIRYLGTLPSLDAKKIAVPRIKP